MDKTQAYDHTRVEGTDLEEIALPIGAVRVQLVRPESHNPQREWDNPLFSEQQGVWRLIGSAGTGVSSLLLDTIAHRIASGERPENILVIAASKQAASRLRRGIVARVAGDSYRSASTMVRSIHSLAFALLRSSKKENLRLITGAEQDAVIRELLAGHIEMRMPRWPEQCREAIGMVGFARGLRDFLLRAVERGLSPEDLEELGHSYDRPMWSAAGEFLREYEQIMALGGTHSLSASELVSMVLETELPDTNFTTIIVDDAQHLDPKSAELVAQLIQRASFAVIAGDPEQSVYRFRGARPTFLTDYPVDNELKLHIPHRIVAQPGAAGVEYRELESVGQQQEVVADIIRRAHLIDGVAWKDIAVVVRSVGMIASIRRGLLAAGVPVHIDPTDIVLSQQHIVAALLLAVRAVREKITPSELEELVLGPIGGADAVTLRRLFRALRKVELRYHRASSETADMPSRPMMRRAIDILADIVLDAEPDPDFLADVTAELTQRELDILSRIRTVLAAGRQPGSVEEILWNIWSATNLDRHLLAVSLRGGAAGSQADRDLDSVMALFDAAGDWVERRPTASIDSFIAHIREQELPTGVRDRRLATPEAVSIVTAHATSGQQWDTVVVCGVQEGQWPSLGETGTLFGQEELVDLIDDGIEPGTPISRAAERLAEERRLFHMATSRATRALFITAVDAPDAEEALEPSRFVREFAEYNAAVAEHDNHAGQALTADTNETITSQPADETTAKAPNLVEATRPHQGDLFELLDAVDTETTPDAGKAVGLAEPVDSYTTRLLSVPAIVAELRRALINPQVNQRAKDQAARQLARLADAGIPGADPTQWWGIADSSETTKLTVKRLSPSRIEAGLECPLRATLHQVLTDEETPIALLRGTLLHAFAEAIATGADVDAAREAIITAFDSIVKAPQWLKEHEIHVWKDALDRTALWLQTTRAVFEQVGVEIAANVQLPNGVQLVGRIDRLEKTDDGGYHIVDFKSGINRPTKDETQNHVQLMAYQLALRHGQLTDTDAAIVSGSGIKVDGASLVYPEKPGKTIATVTQASKSDAELAEFAAALPPLVEELSGPVLRATTNRHCRSCQLSVLCPARDTGQWLTHPTTGTTET
ncbi:DNA/RNA helicase, superfamily I [Corynebacterium mustelae]|uniref:DNA 3'-5' helicase n=1 Tax=Corynebacterium mustelae TaxID=571915 RepID=A0A0G3GVJ3_9CORY|nr:ATP-dependent DNA helicase [Corynebacterium mustelae]AKK05149.1 DNA/RNA helicase, superfamily I [Corynebacterium mustelae]